MGIVCGGCCCGGGGGCSCCGCVCNGTFGWTAIEGSGCCCWTGTTAGNCWAIGTDVGKLICGGGGGGNDGGGFVVISVGLPIVVGGPDGGDGSEKFTENYRFGLLYE